MNRRLKIKIVLISLWILVSDGSLFSQSWSQYALSSLNPYREIGAYGGLDRATMFTGEVRSQWSEFGGNPQSQYLGVHSPVYIWNGGAGMDILNQGYNGVSIKQIRASYTYVVPASIGYIALGARAGFAQLALDGNSIITPEGDYGDGSINHNDPILNAGFTSGSAPTWQLSSVFMNSDLMLGVGVSNVGSGRFRGNDLNFHVNPQVDLIFRYYFSPVQGIDIQATLMAKSDFVNLQSEINAIARINGNIFGGLSVRGYSSSSIDAVGAVVGHALNERFSLFYNYEFGINDLRPYHRGTHELMMRYRWEKLFGTGLPPKVIYNPRHL